MFHIGKRKERYVHRLKMTELLMIIYEGQGGPNIYPYLPNLLASTNGHDT